eukprot:gene4614-9166_t
MKGANLNIEHEFANFKGDADLFFLHGQLICQKDKPYEALRSLNEAESLNHMQFSKSVKLLRSRIYLGQGEFTQSRTLFYELYLQSRQSLEIMLGLRLSICLDDNRLSHTSSYEIGVNSEAVGQWRQLLTDIDDDLCVSIRGLVDHTGIVVTDHTKVCQLIAYDPAGERWLPPHLLRQQLRQEFALNKYVILRRLLDPSTVHLLEQWTGFLVANGYLTPEPSLRRITMSSDRLGMLLAHQFRPLISHILGTDSNVSSATSPIVPTYSFLIVYQQGGFIQPHTDRKQNEFSVTLNIQCPPQWPINIHHKNSTVSAYFLSPGDALLYRGVEVVHSRKPLVGDTAQCIQLVFGYRKVDRNHCNSN